MFTLVYQYLWANKIISLVGSYIIFSVLIKVFLDIDISIPCLWKSLFSFNCPGCGLTTASVKLTGLDVVGAYQANPLIFAVVPGGVFYMLTDFIKFKKRNMRS